MLSDEVREYTENYRLIKNRTENSLLLKNYKISVYDLLNENFTSQEMWLALDSVYYHMIQLN